MSKKYEMIPEGSFYRVKALRDIPMYNVKAGDLGGLIVDERNLSQFNNCWIAKEAKVISIPAMIHGDALVTDEAIIKHDAVINGNSIVADNAQVSGNSRVGGHARVYGNACIMGTSIITDNAWVFGNAQVMDKCIIKGNACLFKNAKVYGNVIISGEAVIQDSTGYMNICGLGLPGSVGFTFFATPNGIYLNNSITEFDNEIHVALFKKLIKTNMPEYSKVLSKVIKLAEDTISNCRENATITGPSAKEYIKNNCDYYSYRFL